MGFRIDNAKIKRWREERGWSQEHLSDLSGLGVRTIQRIETGQGASKDSLMALASAFSVDITALCIDPEEEAVQMTQSKNAKGRAGLRISLVIHLAAFMICAATFTAISLTDGLPGFAMSVPLVWVSVGFVAHAATVMIVEVVTRIQDQGLVSS